MTTKITEIIEDNRGLYDDTLPLRAMHQQSQIVVQRGIIYLLIGLLMLICFYMTIAYVSSSSDDVDHCLAQNHPGSNFTHVWTIDGCRAFERSNE